MILVLTSNKFQHNEVGLIENTHTCMFLSFEIFLTLHIYINIFYFLTCVDFPEEVKSKIKEMPVTFEGDF